MIKFKFFRIDGSRSKNSNDKGQTFIKLKNRFNPGWCRL